MVVVGSRSPTRRVAVTRATVCSPGQRPSGSSQVMTAGSLIVSQTRTTIRPGRRVMIGDPGTKVLLRDVENVQDQVVVVT